MDTKAVAEFSHYISLEEAASLFRDRPAPSTFWRWHRIGVRGVRLQTWLIGGRRRYTTVAALENFIAATTAAAGTDAAPPEPADRSEEVSKKLRQAKVL